MSPLPAGTVTLLFTDIEGSTRLLAELGDRYADVLARVHDLLRAAFRTGGGEEVDRQGDAVFVAFPRAREAVLAAIKAQRAILAQAWPGSRPVCARMGLHTGEPLGATEGYVGIDVHRAARICAVAHGGQVLLSQTTRDLVEDVLPEEISLRDLGEYRLKDLARPQRLFQVVASDLPADFPPLRSLDALPHNLPIQLTSFIGREREIKEVKSLIDKARLLTLTGAGGSGKTRLALQIAAELLEGYPDGVWWVKLAGLADPMLVPQAMASVLRVREQAARPLVDTLVDDLQPRRLLLVMDNCEHLLEACAELADTLLRRCPDVRILATSRERLRIAGEQTWRVPSMALPGPANVQEWERITEYEGVQLFVERALAVLPGFRVTPQNARTIATICRSLDGIPLALELAAARVSVLSSEEIAARLGERFRLLTAGGRVDVPRHQTLRAAMDWSYDLLTPPEQGSLRRLSVFASGMMLNAVEAVCTGQDVGPPEVLDLLAQLVDKSVVVVEEQDGHVRFRLLETVRQYAREKLVEAGEAREAGRRHRDFFLGLAEEAEPGLRGSDQAAWLRRLDTEYDNLRVALEWSRTEDETAEGGLRLAWALGHYWDMRSHLSEGREWLAGILARAGEGWPALRAKGVNAAGVLAYRQGDYASTAALCTVALALSDELSDQWGRAIALHYLAHVAQVHGDHARAAEMMAESVTTCRDLGETWGMALSTNCLGDVVRSQADYPRAATLLEQSLALFRTAGDKWGMAMSLHNLGYVRQHLRDNRRAAEHFEESLALSRELNFREIIIMCLAGLAGASAGDLQPERAARLLGAADALLKATGAQLEPADRPDFERNVGMVRARLGEAAFAAAWAEGQGMTLKQAIEYALALVATPAQVRATKKTEVLTRREQEVAALIARGLTNREIAKLLVITERTAETHVQHILNKLGVNSRAQVAAWAVEYGLYTPSQN